LISHLSASDVLALNNLSRSAATISAAQQVAGLINTDLRVPLPLNLKP
jgi:hypothetical protein